MLKMKPIAKLAMAGLMFVPVAAMAQDVGITRSSNPELPYTLIYPQPLVATGGGEEPVVLTHPSAPLQCNLLVVPAEDTGWTAEAALAALDDAQVAGAWQETLPGFSIGNKSTVSYQDGAALLYEGGSLGSEMGLPLTLVHTETVTDGRGYVLECLYATAEATQARPMVDFIISNFSTTADAEPLL